MLKEAQLKNKMYALNDMLDQKEALLKEINSNNMTFNVFHEKYEVRGKDVLTTYMHLFLRNIVLMFSSLNSRHFTHLHNSYSTLSN